MSEGVVYDGSAESMRRLVELHPEGARFVCPACVVGLVVALTRAEGVARNVRPGVYCPAPPSTSARTSYPWSRPAERPRAGGRAS